jgi:modification target Cys-rich repeat protein
MNINRKWRLMAAPIALATLGISVASCDEAGTGLVPDLCCREFTPGADLTAINWEIKGDAKVSASFGAFMQAAADFTGAASAAVTDLSAACQQLAIDLGAPEDTVKETNPAKRATAWCKAANDQLTAQVKGKIQLTVQPPSCNVSVNAQASCEAKCDINAECMAKLPDIEVRCEPGQLSGKCDADCTAKCEGSANLAVSCTGTCNGTCEGQCDAMPSGGRCAGKCEGKCRGTCEVMAGAKVSCEGECTGGCSVKVRAPKCKSELKSPGEIGCEADASCTGSCKASASAKAECREPSVELTSTLNPQIVASLKLNLPKIYALAGARGKLLLDNAKAVADFGADFGGEVDISKLSLKAGACIIPAVSALGAALENATASVTASATIVATVPVTP